MLIHKYINFETEDGDLIENVLLPADIPKESIHEISPLFNDYGALYKNVTVLKDIYGNQYRVKGNWKEWVTKVRNEKNNNIGFK